MADSIFGLEGKCAVVTGGAQGIGAGCVDLFARAGANVVIADVQAAKAEEVAERARARGVGALAVEADVREDADVARVTAAALEAFGAIDAAVNNAGGIPAYLEHRGAKSIFEVEWDYFDAIFELNVKSVLRCSQSFAKAMIDGGVKGSIVNITSFQGYRASPGLPVYGAAKAAVVHLTQTMAYELGPYGIRVNAVAPAFIETETTKVNMAPERKAASARAMPLGRTGEPSDLAAMVVTLASPLAGYYTGQHVIADAGLSVTSGRPPSLPSLQAMLRDR